MCVDLKNEALPRLTEKSPGRSMYILDGIFSVPVLRRVDKSLIESAKQASRLQAVQAMGE